ncbi:Zona pellucida-like domain protein [Aphelenchoides besseyi]|nr:Zona pellucida-like domain protein [Aphelenchoides besseyi]
MCFDSRSFLLTTATIGIFSLLILEAHGHFHFMDNEVVEGPTFDCGANEITVRLRTQRPFRGNLYVRDHFMSPKCRGNFTDNNDLVVNLTVSIGDCDMKTIRKSDRYGMNASMTVVVSFHPFFETRYDQAFAVNCFYKNDPINVSWDIAVNDKRQQDPIDSLSQVRENRCFYSIRADTFDGAVVRFAEVGGSVVHRWECEDPSMGILVRNCYATTEQGLAEEVIDERGCPTSPLFNQLTYQKNLNVAFVTTEVFKFPDIETIGFNCNIFPCNKLQNECLGVTPPNCPTVQKKEFKPDSIVQENVDPTMIIIPRTTIRPWDDDRFTSASHRFPLPGRRQKDFVHHQDPQALNSERITVSQQRSEIKPFSAYESQHPQSTTEQVLLLKPRKSNNPEVRSFFSPIPNERIRSRRAEMQNVQTNISVAEPDAVVTSNPRKRHVPVETTSIGSADSVYCLNRKDSIVAVVILLLLSAISLSMSTYVVYDICSSRHRRLKAQINRNSDPFDAGCTIKAFNSTRNY